MKVFPKNAFCINLSERTDRWEKVKNEFNKLKTILDIELIRVNAIKNIKQPNIGLLETFKEIIKILKN